MPREKCTLDVISDSGHRDCTSKAPVQGVPEDRTGRGRTYHVVDNIREQDVEELQFVPPVLHPFDAQKRFSWCLHQADIRVDVCGLFAR